jgi:hypothetical protein
MAAGGGTDLDRDGDAPLWSTCGERKAVGGGGGEARASGAREQLGGVTLTRWRRTAGSSSASRD